MSGLITILAYIIHLAHMLVNIIGQALSSGHPPVTGPQEPEPPFPDWSIPTAKPAPRIGAALSPNPRTELAWIHWPTVGTRYTVEPDGVRQLPTQPTGRKTLLRTAHTLMAQGYRPFAIVRLDDCGGREIWLSRTKEPDNG